MALDCTEVRVGLTGHLYMAPVGTAFPADTATAPAAAWVELGYTTEDGISTSIDTTKEDFRVWQSNTPCRSVVTEQTQTWTFTLVQRNFATLELAFGGGEVEAGTAPGDFIYTPPSVGLAEKAFVLEVIDGEVIDRYLLPHGNPALTGDVNFTKGEMTGYEIEVTALLGPSGWPWQLLTNDDNVGEGVTGTMVTAMASPDDPNTVEGEVHEPEPVGAGA